MTLTVSKIKTPKNVVHAVKNALQDYDLQKYKISTENNWFSVVVYPSNNFRRTNFNL